MKEQTIKGLFREVKYPIDLYDSNGNMIYWQDITGYWQKSEYDEQGNEIYFENSNGFWCQSEYDDKGVQHYYENCRGMTGGTPKNTRPILVHD